MIPNIKSPKEYEKFQKYLLTLGDPSYQKFQKKLLKDDSIVIGIRTPILKQIAKELSRTDYISFLQYNPHTYYEEKVLHGFVLGYLKIEFPVLLEMIDAFLPYNDNWAVNDLTCTNLKVFKKQDKEGFAYIQKLLKTGKTWNIRFALVLLLDYYIKEDYLDTIFDICNHIENQEYYVKMANAWLLSICYIKFSKETMAFLKNCQLDDWTYNKTISKICDSYRVSKEEKEILKQMRR